MPPKAKKEKAPAEPVQEEPDVGPGGVLTIKVCIDAELAKEPALAEVEEGEEPTVMPECIFRYTGVDGAKVTSPAIGAAGGWKLEEVREEEDLKSVLYSWQKTHKFKGSP
ncbi:unnamed protein product, partial [Chrysoparadoxa australica]